MFSTLLFLPYVTPMVAVALVFGWFYAPEGGWLNQLAETVGLIKEPVAWLYTPKTALPSVVVVEVWKMLGYNTLLLLAGLQAIPLSVLEAASLDGANALKQTAAIVLPLLSPTLFFVATLTVIHALQAFDSVYLLTQGGPEHASAVIVYWVYKQAFEWFQVGPASAMAYLLFATIAVLTLVQWQARKHWVFNEDGI
jgi:multiple sugar transport system permease protein